ncbi:hypothetical protein [Neobacillus mesonae]|uniref:hypothetical protein n=1 Tax=Neobacillus mesonae TaxID=1193713 RepID=UPI002041ECD9|nr:hypothetical protein [Neobacillus mesonae]MCM3571090.1 hypothetical protein [Neobacillus mesonae]
MKEPFEYPQLFYNEVIFYLEKKWNRSLSDHERHVLIEGYRYGRMIEAENEITIMMGE